MPTLSTSCVPTASICCLPRVLASDRGGGAASLSWCLIICRYALPLHAVSHLQMALSTSQQDVACGFRSQLLAAVFEAKTSRSIGKQTRLRACLLCCPVILKTLHLILFYSGMKGQQYLLHRSGLVKCLVLRQPTSDPLQH